MPIKKTYSFNNYYNIIVILSHGLWVARQTIIIFQKLRNGF